jgi:hypothetical protein
MTSEQRRSAGLLASSAIGVAISLASAFSLVPRVRPVEVLTIFGSAFGAGASLAGAIISRRQSGIVQQHRSRQ